MKEKAREALKKVDLAGVERKKLTSFQGDKGRELQLQEQL